MKKRVAVLAGMLALLAGLSFLVVWLLPVGPAITKANFDRIENGMTLPQVEAILGADRGSRLIFSDITLRLGVHDETWGGDDGIAWIIFDEHRRVAYMNWEESPLTFMERLRQRFPWLRL